jgi:hypothetical protein
MRNQIKAAVRSMVRAFGYDVRKLELGCDAFLDIKYLLADVSAPVIFDVGANIGQTIRRIQRINSKASFTRLNLTRRPCVITYPSRPIGRLLSWKLVAFVGGMSYSIYLWQQPFTHLRVASSFSLPEQLEPIGRRDVHLGCSVFRTSPPEGARKTEEARTTCSAGSTLKLANSASNYPGLGSIHAVDRLAADVL